MSINLNFKSKLLCISIFIVSILFSACTKSGWSELTQDDSGVIYIDHSKTKTIGSRVTITTMQSYSVPIKVGEISYSSSVNMDQYDCLENEVKPLKLDLYSEPMGRGEIVFTSSSGQVIPRNFKEGSIETVWKYACD